MDRVQAAERFEECFYSSGDGRAAVTVGRDAIESPLFNGRAKRHLWRDVLGVSVETDREGSRLELRLAETPERPDRRNSWTGANPACPALPLDTLAPETRERLLAAVADRLLEARAAAGLGPVHVVDTQAEERAFRAKLQSFAPVPWLTWLLVAANVLAWAWTLANGAELLRAPAEKLLYWGGNAASEVQQGEWWRLLSATFLHSGAMHLAMNMVGLAGAGITVERIYGRRLYLLIYLGSGLVGSALSLHFSAQEAVSVGASGAVFGVTGALLVGVFQHRRRLPATFGKETLGGIAFFIVYALAQGFAKEGIDNAAHVGGLLGGCLLAWLLPERFDPEHFARALKGRAVAGIALVLALAAGLAALAPPARLEQRRIIESQPLLQRAGSEFDAAVDVLRREHDDLVAGRMSEREADDRSRAVHAPVFRRLLQDFDRIRLHPADPRQPLVDETRKMIALLLESLEMDSVYRDGNGKPEPADPKRMAAIEAELRISVARLQELQEEARRRQNPYGEKNQGRDLEKDRKKGREAGLY